jgi:acyl-CoA synthetase (AMP-forming)/AMP-acid ligase II
MNNLIACLEAQAARAPWHPFLLLRKEGQWTQLSYGDTLAEVDRWATRLSVLGLPPRSIVCIAIPHSTDLYILFLAAMRAGLVPSFLAYATPKQQPRLYWTGLAELLARTRPSCLIVEPRHLDTVQSIADTRCVVTTVEALSRDATAPGPGSRVGRGLWPSPQPDAIALLQHSSGTTASKKGVALTHAQIAHQVASYTSAVEMTPRDKIVTWLPLYHDMGLLTGFLLPLAVGATIVSLDAFDWLAKPAILFEAIEMVEGTLAWLPNFAFAHMVRVHDPRVQHALGSMRAFISCSEPCKAATMEEFAEAFASNGVRPALLQTCYAMAEAVFGVTQSAFGSAPTTLWLDRVALQRHGRICPVERDQVGGTAIVSCGRPIESVEVAIDIGGELHLGDTGVGEILLRGPFMFGGYFRSPEATDAAFSDGWYRTGDLGFLHDGQLYVSGRLKELIIVHGRNFYAHDIEMVVNQVEGVKPGRVAAVGRYDTVTQSEEVVVIAELRTAADPEQDALRRRIRQRIFDCLELTVRSVELVEPGMLVKTTSGKVAREQTAAHTITPAATLQMEALSHG